jgi:hypothetical protein
VRVVVVVVFVGDVTVVVVVVTRGDVVVGIMIISGVNNVVVVVVGTGGMGSRVASLVFVLFCEGYKDIHEWIKITI